MTQGHLKAKLPLRIFGIDPGSRVVGFACIEAKSLRPRSIQDWCVVDAGVLKPSPKLDLLERLKILHGGMFDLLNEFKPTKVACEKSFYGDNAATGIKLGQARGVLMAAAMRLDLDLCEITPAQVKQFVAGHGRAGKDEIARSLQILMNFDAQNLPFDATDALAVAISCAVIQSSQAFSLSA